MKHHLNIFIYRWLLILATILFCRPVNSGIIPVEKVPSDSELFSALTTTVPELKLAVTMFNNGEIDSAKVRLTQYFRNLSADRYYFNWRNLHKRFEMYQKWYPEAQESHYRQADYQMRHFAPETCWKLPFQNLRGEDVTAYELRHLARQHRASDMALVYYYEEESPQYTNYFVRQVTDLNRAFDSGEYDHAGNGIYEYYRAGQRVHNWLFAHHCYLASEKYSCAEQYLLIKTFFHHAIQLYESTQTYSAGNHHTKGLVALFEIAVVFPEFKDAEAWQKQAIDGLMQHMNREINADGFQFERSIHYHKGDIENYLRVYQLAHLNGIELPALYDEKFRKLFESLVQLAQPNRQLPVLQDDTDSPYAEYNEMDDVMTVGAILFQDPVFGYFAADKVADNLYWLFRKEQFDYLQKMAVEPPSLGSSALLQTGYYTMRNGWDINDCYMTVSAGLSTEKPDHQHADMLGVVAYANGHEILPNYQVKYNDPYFPIFKNSWVKNVALADSLPQGRHWKPNEGQSGFGKWTNLPQPKVQAWISGNDFDYFAGTHNGYTAEGIRYWREIIFVKAGFWVIRDHFQSDRPHRYQQMWQGDYRRIDNGRLRSVFDDGSGLEIVQCDKQAYDIAHGQLKDKRNCMISLNGRSSYVFTTLLIPFKTAERLTSDTDKISGNWSLIRNSGTTDEQIGPLVINAQWILYDHDRNIIALDLSVLSSKRTQVTFPSPVTLVGYQQDEGYRFKYLGAKKVWAMTSRRGWLHRIRRLGLKKLFLEPGGEFIIGDPAVSEYR